MTDRETAAKAAVDAGAVYIQVVGGYGIDSSEAHGARRVAEQARLTAQAVGVTRADYDNARRQH